MKKFTLLAVALLIFGFAGMASADNQIPSGLIKAAVDLGLEEVDLQNELSAKNDITDAGWSHPETGVIYNGGQLNTDDWRLINNLTSYNGEIFTLTLGSAQQSIPARALQGNGLITSLGLYSLDVAHNIGVNALRNCYKLEEIQIAGVPLSDIMPSWTDSQKIALGRVLMDAGIDDEYQASYISGLSVQEIYRLFDQAYYDDFSVGCNSGIPSMLLLPVLFALAFRRKR